MILAAICFLIAWPLVLYPLLARLCSPPMPPRSVPSRAAPAPSVTMLVCALNEERVIASKLDNCLALDYPRDRLRFVFVSDGSTDATAAIIASYRDRGVELVERPARRGKVANLNDVIPALVSDIVVLSDANVIYDPAALRHLIGALDDISVGCASGKVILTNTTAEFASSEESYYSIEWTLQEFASSLYSMPGADGAMYAFRRELYQPPPNDTIIEDFVIPISIVRQRRRVVFVPEARAWEDGPSTPVEEFRRKVRIAAGAAQSLIRGNGWPLGAPAAFWFVFFSHKLLRWASPVLLLAAVALAVLSPGLWLSRLVLGGAAAIAILAAFRALTGWTTPVLNAPFYFLLGQIALLTGLFKGATGRQSVLWKKANR